MTDNIKWIAIQPLTGGMYLGAEEAIGHPAECILSFMGLADYKKNKSTGEIINVGNERNLIEYLKKHNRMPNYYLFKDKKMFQDDNVDDINLVNELGERVTVEYGDIDLVVSVPVCSGLSSATIASSDTKNQKNSNMKFIAKYALTCIKPKVFIMENAPGLFTNSGASMRTYFKTLSADTNYSVIFIKTDTQVHYNAQRRPRTFVMFIRNDNRTGSPDLINENVHINTIEYFEEIDRHITNHTLIYGWPFSKLVLQFFQDKWGKDWRPLFKEHLTGILNIIRRNLYDEFKEYIDKQDIEDKHKESYKKVIDHVRYKVSMGMGYYCDTPIIPRDEYTPAMIFKTIPHILHPVEDRFISIEEALALMGMPYDFELMGEPKYAVSTIGQNVPVKTAKWIVKNALNIINNWDNLDIRHSSVCYYNNLKNTYVEE